MIKKYWYHYYIKSVNEYVDREDEKYDRKKKMLNKNWNEHVFDVVQVVLYIQPYISKTI